MSGTLKPSHRWANGPWPLKTIETNGWKAPKPSKNHWNQWSGGWKSFNGDGWVTPKPSKNNWKLWSVGWKTLNGNGKNYYIQWFPSDHHNLLRSSNTAGDRRADLLRRKFDGQPPNTVTAPGTFSARLESEVSKYRETRPIESVHCVSVIKIV